VYGPTKKASDESKKKEPRKKSLANFTGKMMDIEARKKKRQANPNSTTNIVSRWR
jgi:hypothetical protein